ncbi:hypothetical protein C0993_006406 [Termitomyces sp. T159_Od127]|nr:hypothetical protein C0993_006406 [Termitomyces sp. T159_Od127]
MGNDGGSIPDRRDLVRSKPKRKLEEPVVSCALGKLYNKDTIIEYLLDKTAYGDGETICGHIRSLKDIKKLNLAPNSSRAPMPDGSERPQFICPLTLREMNGLVPFVYLSTCGCVFSQAGLKTVTETSDELSLCPQCGKKYNPATDTLQINPSSEEEENMREAMERQRLLEPSKKAGKKRKAVVDGEEEPSKKKKEAKPSLNPSVAAASRAVVSSLAMEEAKRKAGMSDAIKSLYDDPNRKKRKETFTTMGTFTRYA